MPPVLYRLALAVYNSSDALVAQCRPSLRYSSSNASGGVLRVGPPWYEPVLHERETVTYGLRHVVRGYRARVEAEMWAQGSSGLLGIPCDTGNPWGTGSLVGLSSLMSALLTPGNYLKVALNGDISGSPPTWHRCVIEEFSQRTLDDQLWVGIVTRFVFAKADLVTDVINVLSNATW